MTTTVAIRRKLLKQWFVVLLLGGFSLMLLFKERINEPYPGLFQPSFRQTSPLSDKLKTTSIRLVVSSAAGTELDLDYTSLFFPIEDYGFFFYLRIPEDTPQLPVTTHQDSSFLHYFFQDYQYQLQKKAAEQYPALTEYLEQHAELLTQQDIVRLRFERYQVVRDLNRDTADSTLIETKSLDFESP